MFEDLATMIEQDYMVNGRSSARRLRLSLSHLRDFFALSPALAITTDRVRAYIVQRQAAGAAASSIQKELAHLKRAFNWRSKHSASRRAPISRASRSTTPAKASSSRPSWTGWSLTYRRRSVRSCASPHSPAGVRVKCSRSSGQPSTGPRASSRRALRSSPSCTHPSRGRWCRSRRGAGRSLLFFALIRHSSGTAWALPPQDNPRGKTPKCLCCNDAEGGSRTHMGRSPGGFKPPASTVPPPRPDASQVRGALSGKHHLDVIEVVRTKERRRTPYTDVDEQLAVRI